MTTSKCRFCGEEVEGTSRKKFCDTKCRVAFARKMKEARKAGALAKIEPAHVKQMRVLAFDGMDDDVREILRESVREQVSQHVKDNVLGAAEMMTGMLPKALAGIAKDLESKEWMTRSRAQALVLKYAMSFADKDGDGKELGSITVLHQVPIPDTTLGRRVAEEIEGEVVEEFEVDWPTCSVCHERKPPETMHDRSKGANRERIMVCQTCAMRKALTSERGKERFDPDSESSLYG